MTNEHCDEEEKYRKICTVVTQDYPPDASLAVVLTIINE